MRFICFVVFFICCGCSKIEEQLDIGMFFGDDQEPKIVEWTASTAASDVAEPGAEEPSNSEPQAPEPSAVEPGVEEPSAIEPNSGEPNTAEPSVPEPAVEQPSNTEPSAVEPGIEEPTDTEPSAVEPSVVETSGEQPSTTEPSAVEPGVEEPSAVEPNSGEPSNAEPSAVEPAVEPSSTEPNPEQTVSEKQGFSFSVVEVPRFPQENLNKRLYLAAIGPIKAAAAEKGFVALDKSMKARFSKIKCTAGQKSVCSAVVTVHFIKTRETK